MKIKPFQRFALWQAVVFLASTVVYSSCKSDNLVGLGIQPLGQFDSLSVIDSLTVLTTTRVSDPIISNDLQNYLGEIESKEFGKVRSNVAVEFFIGAASIPDDFSDYTIDSCILHVSPAQFYYGDHKDGPMVEVYRLNAELDQDEYKGDFEPSYDNSPVAEFSLAYDTTSIILIDGDSNNKEPFHYQTALTNELASELRDWFTNPDSKNFDGLYFRTKENTYANNGCLYQMSLQSEETRIRLYLTNNKVEPADHFIVSFPIATTSKKVCTYRFEHEGSDFQRSIDSALVSASKVYIQGLGGSKGVVKIPELSTFANGRNLAISKAELILPVDTSQTKIFNPAFFTSTIPRVYILDDDPDKETLTLDFLYSPSRNTGIYDEDLMVYKWDITRTVQKVVDEANLGNDENYGFTLNFDVPSISTSGNVAYQMVLLGSKQAVLKVYYTDITD